ALLLDINGDRMTQQRDQLVVLRQGRPGEQDQPRPFGQFGDNELHVLDEVRTDLRCGFPNNDCLERAEGEAAAPDVVDDPPRGARDDGSLMLETPLLTACILYIPQGHEDGC